METNQTHKGMKFLFAYFDPQDKCWYIAHRRFILTEFPNKELYGQFLQSIWYNKLYSLNNDIHFVVMGVDKNKSANDVEKDMNKYKNPFPSFHDIPYYLKHSAYYVLDQNIMMRSLKELNIITSFDFTLKSVTNPYQVLTLKLFRNPENTQTMFISTPSFKMPLNMC